MNRTGIIHDSKIMSAKKTKSAERNLECYLGKLDLLRTWQTSAKTSSPDYQRELRRRVHLKKTQLKVRGATDQDF